VKLVVAENYADLSAKAFKLAETLLAGHPQPCVVLPTGNTPLGFYAACVKAGRNSRMSAGRFVQLDEYLDIAPDDPRTLSGWLDRIFLGPLGIGRDRLVAFDSATKSPDAEAARVETAVRSSGVDLALLGLGPNGHLGFNEPGSAFESVTRPVPLTPESIMSNAVYWGGADRVPRRAFTLGLGTLATARHTILLVSGAHKAGILRRVLEEAPSTDVPATCLSHVAGSIVVADRAALGSLSPARIAAFSQNRGAS
jgi:glucosamine-6-phosphate deaminase